MDIQNSDQHGSCEHQGKELRCEELIYLQEAICVLGGKWKLPIINSICLGNKNFRAIERSVPGITPKMLSKELKEMCAANLLIRRVTQSAPIAVEYVSTPYCKSFTPLILAMIRWGKNQNFPDQKGR